MTSFLSTSFAHDKNKKVLAKTIFGNFNTPTRTKVESIGKYNKGCLNGGVELPVRGETWQIINSKRGRNWGHPELIAFTKMLKNKFYIGVMSPDGSGERLLAQGYLVEGPTWAPNGRVLMYFKQEAPIDDGKSTNVNLFKIDITGFRETRIVTPSDGSDPAWSPLLPN